MPLRTYLFAALLALALPMLGCAHRLDPFKLALTASTSAYEATNTAWSRDKAAERDACLVPPTPPAESPACVERVIAAWAPRSAAVKALYAALLSADRVLAVLAAKDALKEALDLAPLEAAVAAVIEAVQAIQAVK